MAGRAARYTLMPQEADSSDTQSTLTAVYSFKNRDASFLDSAPDSWADLRKKMEQVLIKADEKAVSELKSSNSVQLWNSDQRRAAIVGLLDDYISVLEKQQQMRAREGAYPAAGEPFEMKFLQWFCYWRERHERFLCDQLKFERESWFKARETRQRMEDQLQESIRKGHKLKGFNYELSDSEINLSPGEIPLIPGQAEDPNAGAHTPGKIEPLKKVPELGLTLVEGSLRWVRGPVKYLIHMELENDEGDGWTSVLHRSGRLKWKLWLNPGPAVIEQIKQSIAATDAAAASEQDSDSDSEMTPAPASTPEKEPTSTPAPAPAPADAPVTSV